MTKLSTLLAGGDLAQIAIGRVAVVLGSKSWRRDVAGMTPERDVDSATQTAMALAGLPLDTAIRTASCSRLTGRGGMFEIRRNGVRFYGAKVGEVVVDGRPIAVVAIVVVAAEQKGGRAQANSALLDRAEAELAAIRVQFVPDNVVAMRPAAKGHGKKR